LIKRDAERFTCNKAENPRLIIIIPGFKPGIDNLMDGRSWFLVIYNVSPATFLTVSH
jgi:hypothetical protein